MAAVLVYYLDDLQLFEMGAVHLNLMGSVQMVEMGAAQFVIWRMDSFLGGCWIEMFDMGYIFSIFLCNASICNVGINPVLLECSIIIMEGGQLFEMGAVLLLDM